MNRLKGLYFDGRRDKTLVFEKIDGINYRKFKQEEHISLISEPGGQYIGHVTTKSGTAHEIKKSIVKYIEDERMAIEDLVAIGADGTAVNTGFKAGVIRLLEIHFGHSLQWLVCQFHGNELPFRHLFNKLDGKTSGPSSFSGPIGKMLQTSSERKIVKFVSIPTDLPIFISELSTDQKYLFEICHAISRGKCTAGLANRQPGKISHSRWLTTANNLLRLYISTEQPSSELFELANYIVKVYAPSWFRIKRKSKCTDRAKNLWYLANTARYLTEDLRTVVDACIQRNGFFGHPENILLAMLDDHAESVRQFAVDKIIKARTSTTSAVRIFKV